MNSTPHTRPRGGETARLSGFSLVELMIALAICLTIMASAVALLASTFNTRSRENQKSDALSDAQRALNSMTREIANSGYGLRSNGIVAADSTDTAIRVRANLNAALGETTSGLVSDRDEDVKYSLFQDGTYSYIIRLDVNTAAQQMVLANRVDALKFHYYGDRVTYATPSTPTAPCDISNVQDLSGTAVSEVTDKAQARYVVISVCVELPAVGTQGATGYVPASRVHLVSDAMLRNTDLNSY